MLRNVNRLKTLVNDEGQMTNDSVSQLALIAPTYLFFPNCDIPPQMSHLSIPLT
ncbi:hypothetical protein LC605_17615 [Nostoc sp. CHAB 5836]|nr:hypothetical protein [Nostoc sp. CHAB 5836]